MDVDATQTMEWEEFTSYMVDVANASASGVDAIVNYESSDIVDTTDHSHSVDFVKYFPMMDRIIVFERSLHAFKIYTSDLKLEKLARGHFGDLICATHIPEHNLLVTSSADRTIRFWNTQMAQSVAKAKEEGSIDVSTSDIPYMAEVLTWNVSSPQMCLAWANGLLFSADSKSHIFIWDVVSLQFKGMLMGHTDIVMDILPLPLGCIKSTAVYEFPESMILSCSMDCTIRLWDVVAQKQISSWKGHKKAVLSLTYSETMNLFVSSGMDNLILIWRADTSCAIFQLNNPNNSPGVYITGVSVIEGTPELISVDTRGNFCIFDLRTFRLVQRIAYSVHLDHTVEAFTFLPKERSIIASTNTKLVRFDKVRPIQSNPEQYDLAKKKEREIKRARAHANSRGPISRVLGILHYQINEVSRFASDQSELKKIMQSIDTDFADISALQGRLGTFFPVWASHQIRLARSRKFSTSDSLFFLPVVFAEYIPASLTFVACVGRDLIIWNALNGKMERNYLDLMPSYITAACLDGRKRRVFLGDHSGNISAFAFTNGAFMYSLRPHDSEISKLVYASEISTLITASWDGTVRYYEESACANSSDRLIRAHEKDVTCLSYSPQFTISCCSNSQLIFFNPTHLRAFDSLRFNSTVSAVHIFPYSSLYSFFVVATVNGEISLWKILPQLVIVLVATWTNFYKSNEDEHTENQRAQLEAIFQYPAATKNVLEAASIKSSDPLQLLHEILPIRKTETQKSPVLVPAVVTCFEFQSSTKSLYTGDETGQIKIWSLDKLLENAVNSNDVVRPPRFKPTTSTKADAITTGKNENFVSSSANLNLSDPFHPYPIETSNSATQSFRENLSSSFSHNTLPEYLRLSNNAPEFIPESPLKRAGFAPQQSKKMSKSVSLPALLPNFLEQKREFHPVKHVEKVTTKQAIETIITDVEVRPDSRSSFAQQIRLPNSQGKNRLETPNKQSERELDEEIQVDTQEYYIVRPERPIMFPNIDMRPKSTFKAHQDSVTGIQLIEKAVTPAMLTWGFDGGCEIWALNDNRHLSSLISVINRFVDSPQKGNSVNSSLDVATFTDLEGKKSSKKNAWNFFPDYLSHAQHLEREVTRVLDVMTTRRKKEIEAKRRTLKARIALTSPNAMHSFAAVSAPKLAPLLSPINAKDLGLAKTILSNELSKDPLKKPGMKRGVSIAATSSHFFPSASADPLKKSGLRRSISTLVLSPTHFNGSNTEIDPNIRDSFSKSGLAPIEKPAILSQIEHFQSHTEFKEISKEDSGLMMRRSRSNSVLNNFETTVARSSVNQNNSIDEADAMMKKYRLSSDKKLPEKMDKHVSGQHGGIFDSMLLSHNLDPLQEFNDIELERRISADLGLSKAAFESNIKLQIGRQVPTFGGKEMERIEEELSLEVPSKENKFNKELNSASILADSNPIMGSIDAKVRELGTKGKVGSNLLNQHKNMPGLNPSTLNAR